MCFSATGSFALSGILTVLGATSLARNSSKPHRMFAAIPLLFAAQQAAEGMVWLTLNGSHGLLNRLAVSTFVGIALVVWPTWLPFALRLAERDPRRRRALGVLLWAGSLVASCALLLIARFPPFAQIQGHSINYEYAGSGDVPRRLLFLVAYVIPTVVPFFVTTLRMARLLGVVLVLSLLTAFVVQREALTSVWCFFAAILSGLILLALDREQRAPVTRPAAGN
ncbi:MAG TPA: DUF6629 family protein [Polyangiaceae bacterium]